MRWVSGEEGLGWREAWRLPAMDASLSNGREELPCSPEGTAIQGAYPQ